MDVQALQAHATTIRNNLQYTDRRPNIAIRLPRAVVEVRVPRRPGAVEGERELLVMLVFLTPKPKRLEHFCNVDTIRYTCNYLAPVTAFQRLWWVLW